MESGAEEGYCGSTKRSGSVHRRVALMGLLCLGLLGGCSGSQDSGRLAVDLIDDAIRAVDEFYSQETAFYEINATSDGVNLFVSTTIDGSVPGVVQARFTAGDGLVVADEALPSDGPTFLGSAVDFDASSVLDAAVAQLSSSTPRVFIVTSSSDSDSILYRLVMESQRGGRLAVLLTGEGTILGTDVLD